MINFEPMKEKDFPEYWKYSIESWSRDMQRAGLLKENITYEEGEEQIRKFLPEGQRTPGHHFMNIVSNGTRVGKIWYEVRERVTKEAYLWDIVINENQRGKGYGEETMGKLEEEVKKEGAKRIQLNVFGYNSAARNLYLKMGYNDMAITMIKYI